MKQSSVLKNRKKEIPAVLKSIKNPDIKAILTSANKYGMELCSVLTDGAVWTLGVAVSNLERELDKQITLRQNAEQKLAELQSQGVA